MSCGRCSSPIGTGSDPGSPTGTCPESAGPRSRGSRHRGWCGSGTNRCGSSTMPRTWTVTGGSAKRLRRRATSPAWRARGGSGRRTGSSAWCSRPGPLRIGGTWPQRSRRVPLGAAGVGAGQRTVPGCDAPQPAVRLQRRRDRRAGRHRGRSGPPGGSPPPARAGGRQGRRLGRRLAVTDDGSHGFVTAGAQLQVWDLGRNRRLRTVDLGETATSRSAAPVGSHCSVPTAAGPGCSVWSRVDRPPRTRTDRRTRERSARSRTASPAPDAVPVTRSDRAGGRPARPIPGRR
jgi:hypothetical protein